MVASPNYFRGIINGSTAEESVRSACAKVSGIYESFWVNQGIAYNLVPFDGRSDYASFLKAGIPAGGLHTGSDEPKGAKAREKYGGYANAPFDPCYHQSCDTLANLNVEVLMESAQSAANILQTLGRQSSLKSFLSG